MGDITVHIFSRLYRVMYGVLYQIVRTENEEINHLENNVGQGAMPLGQMRPTSSTMMSHADH